MNETGALRAHEPEASDPLIGKILQDRYRVVRKLGEGGMGAVYEGEHLVIKKRVAIKLLHPQFAMSGDIVARFHQEALAATAIGHEHIVEVNDMGRTPEGAIFMVLEFLSGTDFAGLLEKEPRLPIGRVVHIVVQVCDGLAAAHAKGIVHRDLKPENIFLLKRGGDPDFVKVLDFGISKFQSSDTGGGAGRAATKTGSIMGTAYYMSPEQAQGKKSVDHRTDIWALGVILYRALTGRYPFDDDAYPMLIVKICTETPTPIRTLRPDVPEALANVIDRCLTRDVDRRVQDCPTLKASLLPFESITAPPPKKASSDAFASTMPSDSPKLPAAIATPVERDATQVPAQSHVRPSMATGVPSSNGPRWMGIVGLVVVAAALAGGGAWWVSTRAPDPTAVVAPPPSTTMEPPPTVAEAIDFIVSPTDAVVLIDGRPATSAEDGHWSYVVDADDAALHELRIEARGFRSRVEDVRLSYHQRIVVDLQPGTGVDDRRGTAPPPPPSTTTGHHPRATAPATTASPATTVSHAGGGSDVGGAHGTRTGGGGESAGGGAGVPTAPPTSVAREPDPPATVTTPEGVVAPPPPQGLKRLRIP